MSNAILKIWDAVPGEWFFLCSKTPTKWREHPFRRSELIKIKDFIQENLDKDLYFCPHGFNEPKRRSEVAAKIQCLWADLDEVDPEKISLEPTLAIESSPGRYAAVWLLNAPISQDNDLNRRLTYALNADKGGWDLTQVLRIPNTVNYKYKATPKVRLLWYKQREYSPKEIERITPKQEDVSDILKKYQRKLKKSTLRELTSSRLPEAGKRSEMIWKLEHDLADAGMSKEEAFIVIKASVWNKFKGRRDEDKQLQREIDKIFNEHDYVQESDYKFLSTSLDQVQEEDIDWIWYPYFARKELTIVEGDPGVGKSYMVQMVCKSLCDSDKLPNAKRLRTNGGPSMKLEMRVIAGEHKIVYFDMENNAATVTKKRMRNNGLVNAKNFYQEEEPFSIDDVRTFEAVCDAIEELKPSVVVFDTINTYIGKVDSHKATETNQAFAQFKLLAKRYNCAVVAIRHLTKGDRGGKAIYRGQGSIAFAGMARVIVSVGISPHDTSERIAAVTKLNVVKPPPALVFAIEALPDLLNESDRSRFRWVEWTHMSSDELLEAKVDKRTDENKIETEAYLLEKLGAGDFEVTALVADAEAHGIAKRSLYRVAQELGVQRFRKGFGGAVHMRLRRPNDGS